MSKLYIHPAQEHQTLGFWQKLHLDFPLLCCLILLSSIGLLVLYSASQQNVAMVSRQAVHLGIGFMGMLLVAQINPLTFYRLSPWFYLLGISLLIAVLLIGDTGKGAQRWLQFGSFRFQPSELVKLAVPLGISWYFHRKSTPPQWSALCIGSILILLPTFLIIKQPDLGTSLLIACSGFGVLIYTGIKWRKLILAGILTACAAPLMWFFLHNYQKQRILTFLNPESDPLGTGWNIIQSKITIGSGGLSGQGWLQGSQSHLHFLPESSTDFIFAVLAEEFGLIGVICLLTIYLITIGRVLFISVNAQDTFGRLLTASLILTFFVYIFVNIGMVSGILPVVGLPLPLISYGGTSIVSMMLSFGIISAIHTHRKLLAS